MNKRILITTLGSDPHTQGLFKFARIAREAGYEVTSLPPGSTVDEILSALKRDDPAIAGFSYRLSAKSGLDAMTALMTRISENGQLKCVNGDARRFAFAGLPETVDLVQGSLAKYGIAGIRQAPDPLVSVAQVLDFLEIFDARRETILKAARQRLMPPRIEELDRLAGEVVADPTPEPPLPMPSEAAKKSYTQRIRESWPARPILRTHYGEPGDTIAPTVEGIRKMARAGVIDEVSLGSSDLSQRFYNQPSEWVGKKNDGGVPYRELKDLVELRKAAECGNWPAMKPYSHVTGMESFVDDCIKAGMLIGSHQAVPLYWFNRIDGRGPADVHESILEHMRTVKKLAGLGLPVEMNDPNHWSSRWGSDAVVVADYGLIASAMLACGVKDMVLQMQFNKPRETSDCADLAKFLAAQDIVRMLIPAGSPVNVWLETRTGIDPFEPDLEIAKRQLARSTLLQMFMAPHAMHLVSYCEALHLAKPEDIIDSSALIRRAVRLFHKHEKELLPILRKPEIVERRAYLVKEATWLLRAIGGLHPKADRGPANLFERLGNPDVIFAAIEKGYMAAPGIFTEPFRRIAANTHTDVVSGGYVNPIDPVTLASVTEEMRMALMK